MSDYNYNDVGCNTDLSLDQSAANIGRCSLILLKHVTFKIVITSLSFSACPYQKVPQKWRIKSS